MVADDRAAEADLFVPEVYPSRAEAARALGGRWARAASASPEEGAAVTVRIRCDSPDLFRAFSEGLVLANPNARPVHAATADREEKPRPGEVRVSLASAPSRNFVAGGGERAGFPRDAGVLTLTADAGDGGGDDAPSSPLSARFVEKPWLSDFAGFVAGRPGGRWVVGRTHPLRPAATAADAARDARASAAEEIFRLVQDRVPAQVGRDGRRLRGAVEAVLVGGDRLVVDRFPQTFERGYGTLYREAVLIDASDAKLAPLVDGIVRSARAQREARHGTIFSAAAVLLVTYALYCFANAFTRGYFTWSLRTAAAVVAAGAVTILAATAA